MFLVCMSLVTAATYNKEIPLLITPDTDYTVNHVFNGLEVGENVTRQEVAVSEIFENITFNSWNVQGANKDDVEYVLEGKTHKWVIAPTANTVTLSIVVTSPSLESENAANSVVIYPPGEIKNGREITIVRYECTKDDVQTCWDDTVIVTKSCIDNKFTPTDNTCPIKPPIVVENATETIPPVEEEDGFPWTAMMIIILIFLTMIGILVYYLFI